jgi:hypothetical protein
MRQGRCRYANPATPCHCKGCDGGQHGEAIAIQGFVQALPQTEMSEEQAIAFVTWALEKSPDTPVWIEHGGRILTASDAVEIGIELERRWQEHLRAEVSA